MERVVYLTLFLLFDFFQTTGTVQFTSTYQGKNLTGLVGSSVNFTWAFSGDVDDITWGLTRSGIGSISFVILSLDKTGITGSGSNYTDRVSGSRSGDSATGQVIFTMTSITKDDENVYGCRIKSANPFDSPSEAFTFVRLVVEGPPSITQISGNQTVNEGDNLTLTCTADGNPTPTITWTRLSDNSVVTMPLTISRQSEGGYRCTADNRVGNPATVDIFVTVQYKPSGITISTGAAQNTATQGQDVTLTCHVKEAKPPVSEYRFYRNGSLLTPTTNVNNFILRGVRRSQHFGEYKCAALNAAGNGQSGAVVLNINVPAEIQNITTNITVKEGRTVELRCDVTGYPSPTITWKKDGQQKKSGSSLLRIASSTRSDTGAYVCTADNGVGRAEKETFVTVRYKPTITAAKSSAVKSWIERTVILTCKADGLPTPTITWKKADGNKVKEVTATQNIANAQMKTDQDFGTYTCEAKNIVGAAATRTVEINQIKAPSPPEIVSEGKDIQATSLTVKWTAPADDGGSPITAYRVVIVKDGKAMRSKNITDLNTPMEKHFRSLNISTNYTLRVYARNFVFEGDAGEKIIRTKFQGVPSAVKFTVELNENKITLTWKEPDNNGAAITKYSVYQQLPNDKEWKKIKDITDVSKREFVVQVDRGKKYEFVVTASNRNGESSKDDFKSVTVSAGKIPSPDPPAGRVGIAVIAGAAAAGVLVILFLILFVVWWKRRKTSSDAGSSEADLRRTNLDDFDDGYSAVGAARQLQASGAVADVTYAEVDKSGKRNRQQVTDEYAEVDKSKKNKKKPKKKPGELDYAELDDLRPNFRPAPQPSGGAARPLVRPPAYGGTLYADIAQFGVPQPEPTYDNVPKKDVVYSNVESM